MNKFSDMKYLKTMAVLIAGLLYVSASAATEGKWKQTPEGLPYYEYASSSSDEDPYFLLGNYRLNLRTHVNGIYKLISGERVWARFNADPQRPGYGRNRAVLMLDNASYDLVGDGAVAAEEVCSGIGFTRYDYLLDNALRCSRMISVMPSEEVNHGNPCFLLTVTLRNVSNKARTVTYDEVVIPGFVPIYAQETEEKDRAFTYPYRTSVSFRTVTASFNAIPQWYFQSYSPDAPFLHEAAPEPLVVYSPDAFLSIYEDGIHAKMEDLKIRPGKSVKFNIIIGVSEKDAKRFADDMLAKAKDGQFGAYADMWKSKLPDYSSERDVAIRSELYWNAHVIEASAMYDEYFGETYVPAGSDMTYRNGLDASNADHLEAALAACHTNPELAKSIIRYVMSHSDAIGEIASGNAGHGFALPSAGDDVSLQTRIFYVLAEYLRVTGDYAFLNERIALYPKDGRMLTVVELVEKYFMRLRDLPSYGRDADVVMTESAVLAASLPVLAAELKESRRAASGFVAELEAFGKTMEQRFLAGFSLPSGDAEIDVTPYAYYMQMTSVPVSDRRECYYALYDMEWLDMELQYPLILGLSSFDGIEAMKLYRKLSYETMSKNHPDMWDIWHSDDYLTRPHYWPLYLYARMHE